MIDQKSQRQQAGQTRGGQDPYPVDNETYDIMQVMVSKLEAIEAYSKYMNDASQNTRQLFQRFMEQERTDVNQLMELLKARMR